MENEDKIVELLAEMLIRQDQFVEGLKEVKNEVSSVKQIEERQEKLLIPILEILTDAPKFDELLDVGYIQDKNQIILKKHR